MTPSRPSRGVIEPSQSYSQQSQLQQGQAQPSQGQILQPLVGSGSIQARQAEGASQLRASLFGGRLTVDHRRWACREAEFRWTAPQHVIILTQRGLTSKTHIRHGYFREADLFYTALWLDPTLELPGCTRLAKVPLQVNTDDTVVRALLSSLATDLAAGSRPESAYLEHLVALVAMRLADATAAAPPRHARAAQLGRAVVSRLTEYIDAHLDQGIALGELAHLARMPVDNFARRFRAEMGMAPYAYVITRRVLRAQGLLRSADMSISAMALELGFSSQSHFTSTFRRLTGATPHAYRRLCSRRQCSGSQDRDTTA